MHECQPLKPADQWGDQMAENNTTKKPLLAIAVKNFPSGHLLHYNEVTGQATGLRNSAANTARLGIRIGNICE
jgi:hypothetical protein